MAASKSKNTGHSGRNTKKKTAMEQEVGRFQTEIILFVILAACVILMASNFGAGGFVGDAISNFCFGLMGLMAYLFPIVFFLESAFILINKTNRLAYKKLAAAFVMFLFLCGAAQLLTDGYMQSTTLLDYYALSADYKTGRWSDRRSDLYFCHICFWNYRRICDHYTGICCMYDHYHTALSA